MRSIRLCGISFLLVMIVGFSSSHANDNKEFLVPIISMILDNEDSEPGTINDQFGGNFTVSPLAFDDTVPEVNCDSTFNSTSSLENAATTTLPAGTTLCLADGTYSSLELNYGGAGTASAPITVAAQNPGKAIISGGDMGVNMRGSYVVLQGIVFRDGTSASSDFLQTRGSSVPCNHCRVTEIAVIDLDHEEPNERGRWIHIYGTHNRIDHSWFSGKRTGAPLLATNRDVADDQTVADIPENFHVIDHNYFGDRPPTEGKAYAENGDNEFEGIQIGTSFAHEGNAFTTVAFNYFERIDGEAEVISVKSSGNVVFNNTIRDSYGSITNRHGNTTLIANNFVVGDGHPFSGGLRIVDDSHRVINNYVEGARFLNTRFHGGIVLHNTDNSTTNGYQVFENNLVAFNTVTNSVNSLNVNGGNRNNPPRDVRFVNNVIDDAVGPVIRDADLDGMPADSVYAGNYVEGPAFSDDSGITSFTGFTQRTIDLQDDSEGIARPTPAEYLLLAADTSADISPFNDIVDDIDGQTRSGAQTSGADENSNNAAVYGLLNPSDVGPINYSISDATGDIPPGEEIVKRVPLNNPGFDDSVNGWTFTAGTQVTNVASNIFARGASGQITNTTGRISQTVTVEPNTNYAITAFTKGPTILGANVGGTEVVGEFNNSEYRHSQFEFNSGSQTSVTLFAGLDNEIESNATIVASRFNRNGDNDGDADDEFSSSASSSNPWIINEGSSGENRGQVQSSSNTASGADGSVRFRYNLAAEVGGEPMIRQVLTGILPNTNYELSAWVVADSGITATMGILAEDGVTILQSKILDDDALTAANAPRADDSFRRDSFIVNSGPNRTLTVFFRYNAASYTGTPPASGNIEDSDLRIDDVELNFEGPTPAGEEAFVDEIRLVSFPGS